MAAVLLTQIAIDQHGHLFALDSTGCLWAQHMSTTGGWSKIESPDPNPPAPPVDSREAQGQKAPSTDGQSVNLETGVLGTR